MSGIRPCIFILATAIGMLPATIIYTFIGRQFPTLEENSPILLTLTVVIIFILKKRVQIFEIDKIPFVKINTA